jgi:arabinogalactan endo-1,4-beta-galactosidase
VSEQNKAQIGNEENMDAVKAAMTAHQQVQLAGNLKEGVPIDFTSLEGNRYTGVIVFKKPDMFDFMKMGARKSEILRMAGVKDLYLVDEPIKYMAHVISTLEIVATKRPEWLLKPTEIKEPELLYHVFGKYSEWENTFRKDLPRVSTDDSEASEGAQAMGTSEVPVSGDTTD